jgi:hypothetical protein
MYASAQYRHSCMTQDTRFVHLTAASKQLFSCQCARTDWNMCVLSLSAIVQLPREWVRLHQAATFLLLSYKAAFSIPATKKLSNWSCQLAPSLNVQTCHGSGGWVISLSPRRSVFYSRRVHAGFGVHKMVVGQVYFQALQLFFSVKYHSTNVLYSFTHPSPTLHNISNSERYFFSVYGTTAPNGPGAHHYRGFTITLRHTTLGRTPLDEWSARRRDLHLTTPTLPRGRHPCLRRESNPAIPASERLQSHVVDQAATGIGTGLNNTSKH